MKTAIPSYYEFYNPVKIVSGHKALENLPFELEQLAAARPMIITDKGVVGAGLIDIVKGAFADSGVIIGAVYDETPPDSSLDTVNTIAGIFRANGCDSLIAVGGGSAIDTAKGVNIVITEESDDLARFMGAEMLKKPMKPLIVVPTTSGTGSEVTLVAVINDTARNMKMLFTSYYLLPKVALLDTRMMTTMPPHITAATGMDALSHAMEAYICLQKNPISDAHALAAVSLIRDHLVNAVKDGKDVEARLAMANAACMAGAAFSNSMVGMVHSLGHAAGGTAHIPHGVAMSIFLPHGLTYNLPKAAGAIGELLPALGGPEVYASTPEAERPHKTIELVLELRETLNRLCGLPLTLRDAGVRRDQLEDIARAAINDGSLIFNPVEMDLDDALEVLNRAYDLQAGEQIGLSDRVLEVDLTTRSWEMYEVRESERRGYLGGKGLGLKLYFDRVEPGIDPLGPENLLAVMPGALMGTGAPCTGRFAAVTKSPLTGIMTASSCGGPFGMALKTAGWDGLLVKGRSNTKVYLEIDEVQVSFHDAEDLWGLTTSEARERMIGGKNSAALVIGPAGENGVRFANIRSGDRFLGRGGLGAVLGAKNVKGIVAKGGHTKVVPKNEAAFRKAKKRALSYIQRNDMTSRVLRSFGTASNTEFTNNHNILPVRNFKDGRHDESMNLSGRSMAERHASKPHFCRPCSIMCGHKGMFNGETLPVPEFETVGLLGSNLGVFDSEIVGEWNRICAEMGLDTISTGGTLAWTMEAAEKGLIQNDLRFGESAGVAEALHDIGYARGFGVEMGMGSRGLAEKYGGTDFAVQVKGMEVSAYDPRGAFGQALSYAVANRGACHLSAYPVALEVLFGLLKPYRTGAKAEFTTFLENLYCCVNSLQTCQFTAFAYLFESPLTKFTPDFLLGFMMQNLPKITVRLIDFSLYRDLWSSVAGIPLSLKEFITAGERIHVLERYMNTREGITRKDDTLPARLLHEHRESDTEKLPIPLDALLDRYYRLRGYDADGVPTKGLLARLGIQGDVRN
jgi:aldehyde:ferredoxin oxidoreductase